MSKYWNIHENYSKTSIAIGSLACYDREIFDSVSLWAMPTEEIKTNLKYQKQIDKSFAVIYHNLKRIHDAKPTEAEQLEITDPGSSSQRRKNRSYSSPSERTLVGTEKTSLATTHQNPTHFMVKQRSLSSMQGSKTEGLKNRRVSFSVDTLTSFR